MPAVLGLDLGTSQVKALLCAADGTVLGRGSASYQVSVPRPGWAETDPEHWWQAACAAVRAAAGPAPAEVAGLAVAGQMHGVILCTERAVALRPAITWLDRRAEAEAADYQRLASNLRAQLGNAPSPGMAGPILAWLSRHEPDTYRQARWALQPKDWLRHHLTGVEGRTGGGARAVTDPTDASGTLLFDLGRGEWATDVAAVLGLRTDLLPSIRPPAEIAGSLLPAAAEQLGLRPGLPVATGAADTAASLFAARLPAGRALLTLGTGGQLIAPTPTPAHAPATSGSDIPLPDNPDLAGDRARVTNLFCSVDGGTYRLAAAQNVGVTLDWVCRTLGASWEELYRTAARPWRGDTPVFLPYLAGERWDASRLRGRLGRPDPGPPARRPAARCSRGGRIPAPRQTGGPARLLRAGPGRSPARRRRQPPPGLAPAAGRRPGRAAVPGRERVTDRPGCRADRRGRGRGCPGRERHGPFGPLQGSGRAGRQSPGRRELPPVPVSRIPAEPLIPMYRALS